MALTKDRVERAATENQFMNGKIHAMEVSCPYFAFDLYDLSLILPFQSFRSLLDDTIREHFPECANPPES